MSEGEVGDYPALQEVFLDDSLEDFRGAGVVPDAFGINEGNRALSAYSEAIGFGPINEGLRADEV